MLSTPLKSTIEQKIEMGFKMVTEETMIMENQPLS
jgi:hypothetical protein